MAHRKRNKNRSNIRDQIFLFIFLLSWLELGLFSRKWLIPRSPKIRGPGDHTTVRFSTLVT